MYKKIAISSLLALTACSGSETSQQLPAAVQAESAENFAQLSDAIAQDFIDYIKDDRELVSIINPPFKFKPKDQCFDYWHKKGNYIQTPEVINSCQLWANELAWLYGTYGYKVKSEAFKSEIFWAHIDNFDFDAARANGRKTKTKWSCPNAPQVGYDTPEIIPLAQKHISCPDITRDK